jgi:hypothetical protein
MATPTLRVPFLVLAGLLACATVASAQQLPGGPAPSGPLVLVPVTTAVVFSPDVKVTSVNHTTGVLAGAYAGKLIENTVFIGGGLYGLVEPRDDARLVYGGLIIGGRLVGSGRVTVTARGLVGVGQATTYRTVQVADEIAMFQRRNHPALPDGFAKFRLGFRDQFMLVEPEVRMALALTDGFAINLGAGYRATSASDSMNRLVRGATGSIGIQFTMK